jgi:carbon catabolite-derepressing protein kinase
MRREEDLLRRLHHPNVVQLLEVIETEHILCLVLELYPVDSLTFLCETGLFKEEQAQIYARQLIGTLEYLHHHDVVSELPSRSMLANEAQANRPCAFLPSRPLLIAGWCFCVLGALL